MSTDAWTTAAPAPRRADSAIAGAAPPAASPAESPPPAESWHDATHGPGRWRMGFCLVCGSWSLTLHLRIRAATRPS